jgi:large subunit ribosomal protein L10
MPTEAKRAMVAELTELLGSSQTTIVTDYRGLTVAEIGLVRRSLREQGVTYRVVKNRLARIAAKESGSEGLSELFEGPSAIALGPLEEAALAKALLDALRPYRTVEVRGALLRGQRIDAASVTRLASLPSREVLLAQLAGAIAAPLSSMAGLLTAPLRSLGGGLQALVAQRTEAGGDDAEAKTEAPAEAPEAPAEEPAEEAPAEPSAEAPEAPAEEPAEAPAEAEAAPENPAEQSTEAEAATEPSAQAEAPVAEAPAEAPAEEPAEEAPAEPSAEAPSEDTK